MHIEILKVSNPNKLWHYNQIFISGYFYQSKLGEPFKTFLSHSDDCGSITGSALTFPHSDCHMVISL